MYRFFLSLFLLVMTTSFASLHLRPGKWGIQGEFIYLYPSVDDTAYAIPSAQVLPTRPIGTRLNNRFHFEPGFRLEGGYGFCNCGGEVHVRWTHLTGKHHTSTNGNPLIQPTASLPSEGVFIFGGNADTQINVHFNSVEGFYQRDIYHCCPLALAVRTGLHWARIYYKEDITYNFPADLDAEIDHYHQTTWGLGPEFGLFADFSLNECWKWLANCFCNSHFSLTFLTTGSLLAAQTKSRFQDIDAAGIFPTVDVPNSILWRLVPSLHMHVGLNFEKCLTCLCRGSIFSLEIGYEFTTYYRALSKIRFLDDTVAGTSLNYYTNFDTHGPYVAMGFAF